MGLFADIGPSLGGFLSLVPGGQPFAALVAGGTLLDGPEGPIAVALLPDLYEPEGFGWGMPREGWELYSEAAYRVGARASVTALPRYVSAGLGGGFAGSTGTAWPPPPLTGPVYVLNDPRPEDDAAHAQALYSEALRRGDPSRLAGSRVVYLQRGSGAFGAIVYRRHVVEVDSVRWLSGVRLDRFGAGGPNSLICQSDPCDIDTIRAFLDMVRERMPTEPVFYGLDPRSWSDGGAERTWHEQRAHLVSPVTPQRMEADLAAWTAESSADARAARDAWDAFADEQRAEAEALRAQWFDWRARLAEQQKQAQLVEEMEAQFHGAIADALAQGADHDSALAEAGALVADSLLSLGGDGVVPVGSSEPQPERARLGLAVLVLPLLLLLILRA